jgi:3-methyladenine DNA glycosylase AlkD
MTAATDRPRSPATVRAVSLVGARRPEADRLGRALAAQVDDPASFAIALDAGLRSLADPEYAAGQQFVAPGIGPTLGVRTPLLSAVGRAFRSATRGTSSSTLLLVADRLLRDGSLEPRWFAFGVLERVIADDPERGWQLLRQAARGAADWITVDTLAHVYGRGILDETYRWAELEQLVYSPSRWERRLVGSTIATIPFIDHRRGRAPDVARRGLELIGNLIGDAEPDVQKALAWALRSLVLADPAAVETFCEGEAGRSVATGDGHRAWVVRDVLTKLDRPVAERLRARLSGIRRRPGVQATSRAAETAGRFAGLGLGRRMPEPPLT